MENFAKIIRELRTDFGFTQESLGEKLGLGKYIVRDWENKRACPSIAYLKKVADFFNVSVDYLLGRADDFGNPIIQTNYEQLSEQHKELISRYNLLSKEEKAAVNSLIDVMIENKTK